MIRNRVDIPTDIDKQFYANIEALNKDDWKLHKQLIHEGVNPLEITKIIRYDDIEKTSKISSETNFDFNQKVNPALYERYSLVNNSNVSLIDYAAFFGSINCFKFLMLNGSDLTNAGKYAVANGNIEIIHLCEQNHSSFQKSYETTIKFHKNKIFHYLYERKLSEIKSLEDLGIKCIKHNNFEIFGFLEKEGLKITENIIQEAAKTGNIFLVKQFQEELKLTNNLLIDSIHSENGETINYILEQDQIDINQKDINLDYLILVLNFRIFIAIFGIFYKHFLQLLYMLVKVIKLMLLRF